MSVYLWTGESLVERNAALLQRLSLLLKSIKWPWVVGGDWNVDAAALQQAGWPGKLGCQLFAPTLATCNDKSTTSS